MRRYPLALLATLVLALVGDHALLAQRPTQICEPGRDKRNPDLEKAKEAKKAQLRAAGYPDRFLKLIDREQCIDCVREASDGFGIMIAYKDNAYAPKDPKTGNRWTHITYRWDPESEVIAREKTKDGTIKGFYILNTSKHDCKCCPEIDDDSGPEDRSDWDPDLQANKDHLIPFDPSNVNGPLPDDLVHPSDKWIGDPVPNIETFQKPAKKQAHAPCQACEGDAQKLNAAYDALEALWDQKIDLLNSRSVLENTVATRENDIALMHYKQRSTLTRTPARDMEIADAERTNETDNAALRANAAALEAVEPKIARATSDVAALEKALVACAAKCSTTVTETPPTAVAHNTPAPPVAPPPPTAVIPPRAPSDPVVPPELQAGCQACVETARRAQQAWLKALEDAVERDRMRTLLAALERVRDQASEQADKAIASAPNSASAQFAKAAYDDADADVTDAEQSVTKAEQEVAASQRTLDQLIAELAACNARCKTAMVTETQPTAVHVEVSEKHLLYPMTYTDQTLDAPHPLQRAFVGEQAAQCGYCVSGIILSAKALLDRNAAPSESEIREALKGNLCRCGTHTRILRAIRSVVSEGAR